MPARARKSDRGLRDTTVVCDAGRGVGLRVVEIVAMPASNTVPIPAPDA